MKRRITVYKYGWLYIASSFLLRILLLKKIMHKLFFLPRILLSITAVSQKPDNKFEEIQRQIAKTNADFDSSKKLRDSTMLLRMKSNDSVEMAIYMEQNTRNLVSFMKEREQKQGMWLRIGAGILLLAVGNYWRNKEKEA